MNPRSEIGSLMLATELHAMTIEQLLIHAQMHGVCSVDFGEIKQELERRCMVNTNNPRTVEQELIRVFVKLAELLDDYCMGGDRIGVSLLDVRHRANEAANAGRALLGQIKDSNP